MTVHDYYLNQLSNAMTANTFTVPSYITFGTGSASILTSDTVLTGEIGTRILLTKSASGNVASYSGVRTPAMVITTTTGDTLTSIGTFPYSTSGGLSTSAVVNGLVHTTTYNIECDFDVTFDRI